MFTIEFAHGKSMPSVKIPKDAPNPAARMPSVACFIKKMINNLRILNLISLKRESYIQNGFDAGKHKDETEAHAAENDGR